MVTGRIFCLMNNACVINAFLHFMLLSIALCFFFFSFYAPILMPREAKHSDKESHMDRKCTFCRIKLHFYIMVHKNFELQFIMAESSRYRNSK